MNTDLDYQVQPFAQMALKLRPWFEGVVRKAQEDTLFQFWRVVLPPGSASDDAIAVSQAFLVLFPERTQRELSTPVAEEFVL